MNLSAHDEPVESYQRRHAATIVNPLTPSEDPDGISPDRSPPQLLA